MSSTSPSFAQPVAGAVESRALLSGTPRLVLLALCLLTLLVGAVRGATKPFWSDELATVHIAEAPSWGGMIARSQKADLNPPLEPTLVRLSCSVFGPHEFGGRLPSILAFTVFVGALFLLFLRHFPLWWAAFGALLPLISEPASYALTETRPYALLLASLGLAFLAYEDLREDTRHSLLARPILFLGLCGLLLSHIFGSYAVAAFLFAEAVRTMRTRRIDWGMWALLLVPLLCCITYLPLLRQQSGGSVMIYSEYSRTSIKQAFRVYYDLLAIPTSALTKLALVIIFFMPFFPKKHYLLYISRKLEIWALIAGLMMTPLIVAAVFLIHAPYSAFYPRYSLAVIVPGYLLLVGFLAWRSGENGLLSRVLAACAVLGVAYTFADMPRDLQAIAHGGFLGTPAAAQSDGGVHEVRPDLPLAVNSALHFMVADYELPPDDTTRMVYVTDKKEALRVTHQNATESIADMAKAFELRSRVEPYETFLARNHQFLLLESPARNDWFIDDLKEHHAGFQLLENVTFAGNPERLWLVTVQQRGVPAN